MSSRPVVRVALVAALLAVAVMALLLGAPAAPADDPAGAQSGPWRCKQFAGGESMEQDAAAWLYRFASTGPGNVISLSPPLSSSRAGSTLCAWDPGFAAEQWILEERARKEHEAQVRKRKRKLREHQRKGSDQLFPEDLALEEEGEGRGS